MSSDIFISHSHSNKNIADSLVDLLQTGLNVNSRQVFCTSLEGMGIPAGENFVSFIHSEIQKPKVVIPIISEEYYKSIFCICELCAAWARSLNCLPLIVPPIEHSDLQSVITGVQATKVQDPQDLNTFADKIESLLGLETRTFGRWEAKRDQFIEKLMLPDEIQNISVSQDSILTGIESAAIAIPSIKKHFTDKDVQQFLKEGYTYVREYFSRCLKVSKEHHSEIDFELKDPETNRFTCKAYLNGNYKSECQVWISNDIYGPALCYADKITGAKNQISSSFSVEKTKQRLVFKSTFGILDRKFKSADESYAEGVAEYLWEQFSERLSN